MNISNLRNKYEIVRFSLFFMELVVILLILSSCNFFLSTPHGRENLDDEAAQITAFTAVPSGENSIVTMWNWKDPISNYDDTISEIKIQHSILGYPENYVFFAGESFTDNAAWQHEWKDLTPNITHYFSLFAKSTDYDGNDTWYAPIKAKVKLPGKENTSFFGFTTALVVDNLNTVITATFPGNIQANAAPYSFLVVELDVPDNIYIVSATIETFVTSGGITTTNPLRIFPVKRFWDDSPVGGTGFSQLADNWVDNYAVDDSVSAFIDSAEPTLNDITEVIKKALLYAPKQIVFKNDGVTDATVTLFNSTFLKIDYIFN